MTFQPGSGGVAVVYVSLLRWTGCDHPQGCGVVTELVCLGKRDGGPDDGVHELGW